jgi:hypothetical protein
MSVDVDEIDLVEFADSDIVLNERAKKAEGKTASVEFKTKTSNKKSKVVSKVKSEIAAKVSAKTTPPRTEAGLYKKIRVLQEKLTKNQDMLRAAYIEDAKTRLPAGMEMPDAAWWKDVLKFPVLDKAHAPCRALWSMLFNVDAANTAMPGVFEFGSSILTDGYGIHVLYEAHRLEAPYRRQDNTKVTASTEGEAVQRSIERSSGAKYITSNINLNGVKRLVAIDPNMNDLAFGVSVKLSGLVGEDSLLTPIDMDEYLTRVNTIETRRGKQDDDGGGFKRPVDRDVTYFRNTHVDLKASRW